MLRKSLLSAAIVTCIALPVAPAGAAGVKAHVHSDAAPRSGAVRGKAARLPGTAAPSQTLPARWCGQELGGDDTANGYDNGPHRFHAVYFVPADRAARLAELGATFQRDAIHASALLERSYGRAIRFDMGTRCGPQYLDITTVRLAQTTAELARLAGHPSALYSAAAKSLAGVLPAAMSGRVDITTNYIGWFDGPAPKGVCGQANLVGDTRRSDANLNNHGGKLALVYRQGERFCDGDVARHEIAHTLGAALTGARNIADGGHVSDAIEDTMATPSAPRRAGGNAHGEFFDFGNDDYWGNLPWWTVDMSRFVCPVADCNVAPAYTQANLALGASRPTGDATEASGAAPTEMLAGTRAAARRAAAKRRACGRARTERGKRVLRCRPAARSKKATSNRA